MSFIESGEKKKKSKKRVRDHTEEREATAISCKNTESDVPLSRTRNNVLNNGISTENTGANNIISKKGAVANVRGWNFEVDYNDHFETPPIAYKDLQPVLVTLATQLNKPVSDLIIYDPYWCKGNMVSHLSQLGFSTVINRNRDFYNDIKNKHIPEYDILVTNPPYSGEHKVKLLNFLASRPAQPYALLLPAYTATKSYWREFATSAATATTPGNNSSKGTFNSLTSPFYVLPPDYYEYCHPEGTGKDIPPFYSAWFVGAGTVETRRSSITALLSSPRRAITSTIGSSSSGGSSFNPSVLKRLPNTALAVQESVDALVRAGYVVDKRPNPKLRKKNKMKLAAGMNGDNAPPVPIKAADNGGKKRKRF